MLNLSKVSYGGRELSEIDITSVFAERSSEHSSPFLSLRIGLLRRAPQGLRLRRRVVLSRSALTSTPATGCCWRALYERPVVADLNQLLLRSALPSAGSVLLANASCCCGALWRALRAWSHAFGALWRALRARSHVVGALWRALCARLRAIGALWRALRMRSSEGALRRVLRAQSRAVGALWRALRARSRAVGALWRALRAKLASSSLLVLTNQRALQGAKRLGKRKVFSFVRKVVQVESKNGDSILGF